MTAESSETPQIAVIGCGAISESYYFPALSALPAWRRRVWLVDPSQARRAGAIARFGFDDALQADDVAALPRSVVAAINATPSHLHVATTMPLIERGVSVLVEKPLAEDAADGRRMLEAARGVCLLGVNHFRRIRPINRFVFEFIRRADLGAVRAISWREGHKFDWPTQSGFYFRRPWPQGRPRGAMLDIGVHVVDLICWWLGAAPSVVGATMDSGGGPEAHVAATLAAGDVKIDLQVSFHAKMANQFVIEFERGTLRGSTVDAHRIEIEAGGRTRRVNVGGSPDWNWIAGRIVGNFLDAIEGRADLLIDAASVLPALDVIDQIYAVATDPMPACYREWVA